MIDTQRLRVFRAVVASGSVQSAASNLGYTSSAVSQQISALQRETGLVLFRKEGRGITPTPAAHALVAQSDDLMGQLTRLESVVTDLREGRKGHLVLGCFASAGSEWMPTLARRLREEMPEITLEVLLTEDLKVRPPLDLDVVIEYEGPAERDNAIRIPLPDDPYVVVLPNGHRLAELDAVPVKELATETLIRNDRIDGPCHLIVVDACKAAGFTPRFPIQAQDHWTSLAFVEAGVGLAVLPELASRRKTPGAVVRPLVDPQPIRHMAALRKDAATPDPAAQRAADLLLEIVGAPTAAAA
ncbi:LysR family transcriptional regulator [Propionibacteriaceae bacterium Y1700]|uniref:LysR family transcriptional regulator n=1 Tax=Microlunatus sp. Y1700 TaxID=3418487 RepID=UPI003DA70F92